MLSSIKTLRLLYRITVHLPQTLTTEIPFKVYILTEVIPLLRSEHYLQKDGHGRQAFSLGLLKISLCSLGLRTKGRKDLRPS